MDLEMLQALSVQFGAEKRKGKKAQDEAWTSISGNYVHNPVKHFWLLTLTCFNVGNNSTTTNNASDLIL